METAKITKIGIVIAIAIAAFIWGFAYLKGENIFKEEVVYYVVYDKIEGLSVSSPVVINGLKIGQVRSINFLSDFSGRILVAMAIENNFPIKKTARAFLYSIDIMGTKAIKLDAGIDSLFHQSGDTLLATIEGDLRDQVEMQMLPLKHKAEDLMLSVDSVLSVIQNIFNENTRNYLSKSFASITTTIKNLETTTFTLDTLVQSEKTKLAAIFSNVQAITLNLKNNGANLNRIILNLVEFSDSLKAANIIETVANANTAVININKIVEKINSGQGSLGLLLSDESLYENLSEATDNLSMLIKDIETNPKKYVHFSAFDLGKTVIIEEPKNKTSSKEKEEVQKPEESVEGDK